MKPLTVWNERIARARRWLACYGDTIRQNPRAWLHRHPLAYEIQYLLEASAYV